MTVSAMLAASVHNGWAELVVVGRGPDGEPWLRLRERGSARRWLVIARSGA